MVEGKLHRINLGNKEKRIYATVDFHQGSQKHPLILCKELVTAHFLSVYVCNSISRWASVKSGKDNICNVVFILDWTHKKHKNLVRRMAYVWWRGVLKAIATASYIPSDLQATGGFCSEGFERSKMNVWNFSSGDSSKDMEMKGVTWLYIIFTLSFLSTSLSSYQKL